MVMSVLDDDSPLDRLNSQRRDKASEYEAKKQSLLVKHNREVVDHLLSTNLTRPIRITKVHVVNAEMLRDTFLETQLAPLLNNERLDLHGLLKNLDLTTSNFARTSTISNIGAILEVDPTPSFATVPPSTLRIIPVIQLDPIKRFNMKIGTNVGNGEGDGYLSLQYRNIFGGGESISFDTNMASNNLNSTSRSTYLLNFQSPILNNANWLGSIMGYHSSKLVDWTTRNDQTIEGITLKSISQYKSPWNYEFSLENTLRSIDLLSTNSLNDTLLMNAGDSFKSSFNFTCKYDTRDDSILPTKGFHSGGSIELSNLLPSLNFQESKFIKLTSHFQHAFSFNKIIFNGLFKFGYIQSLNHSNVHFMDRFFIGGPNDIRGFTLNGLGPKLYGSPIGGLAFYGLSASLFTPLPFVDSESFKTHTFINAGKLISDSNLRDPSVSIGTGLVFKHPIARFELNFVLPLSQSHFDSTRKGFQYGVGISFM